VIPGAVSETPIEPPLRDAAYRIVIDRIGVNASVFTYGLDANRVPEVPLNGSDVAWYNFSDRPGTGSNAVFAGHVTWGGSAVFYKLDEVQVGDQIALRGDNGVELTYTVSESFLVDPEDPNALSVMSPTDKDVITLITCGGSFYYTGDPVFNGDYTHRRIVRATFAGITPQPAAGG
jgi:LPXTG-site transpeptidase (sortase) family protein